MTPLFRLPFGRALVFLAVTLAAEGQPTLVKQIPDASSNFFAAGDFVYFTSNDSLFRTDGTEAGTILLRGGMNFGFRPRFTEYKELLIFTVFSASGPMGEIWEIWRSDGSPSGTFFLTSSPDYYLKILGVAGDYLYLSAADPGSGGELFRTDGTPSGTILLKDINPGENSGSPRALASVGNYFFFTADDGAHGFELWKTDGSASGTVMVKDINPGQASGVGGADGKSFDNRLFFSGVTAGTGHEPWVSDGTTSGTYLLKDLVPGEDSSGLIRYGKDKDGWLYFSESPVVDEEVESPVLDIALWRTDGSTTATTKIKSFTTYCASCNISDYWISNDRLYFFLHERSIEGYRSIRDILYTTDGTATGTTPVFSLSGSGVFAGENDGQLIFLDLGNDESNYAHTAFYRTDGTVSGTEIVRVINSAYETADNDRQQHFVRIGDKIFFTDHDAVFDPGTGGYGSSEDQYQLMQTDGFVTSSIRHMGGGSYAKTDHLLGFNGLLIFTTEFGDYQKRLWLLDPLKPFEKRGTFTWVNADTDTDLQTLKEGDVILLSPGYHYNIRFDPPDTTGSVVFKHQGKIVRRENASPYSLAGDYSSNYLAWSGAVPGRHRIEATAYSGTGGNGTPGASLLVNFTIMDEPLTCRAGGSITREHWNRIAGNRVTEIPTGQRPSGITELTKFETEALGRNYGARIRGFICPPTTGDYVFWIASNDYSELWLSTDDDTSNSQRIAYVDGTTNFRQWNKFRTQRSSPIRLTHGTRYYIEALHKQGVGTDHLSVGWQLPDGTMERPIGPNRLSPFGEQNDLLSHLILPVAGSTDIDPLVVKLETRMLEGASRYIVEVNDRADFNGASVTVASQEDNQNVFIIKDLNSATTYYARVKSDVSGFGPITTFTTRDQIPRLRLWGIASYGGTNNLGTIFSYSIDDHSFVKHYDTPADWDGWISEERLRGILVPGPDGIFYGRTDYTYGGKVFQLNSQGSIDWWGSDYVGDGVAKLTLASNNHIYLANDDFYLPASVDRFDVEKKRLLVDSRMHFFIQYSHPNNVLIELGDGYLYGAAGAGGVNEGGFLYRFRLDGTGFDILKYFYDVSSGIKPGAGLMQYNGFLYGTTTAGGDYGNYGTVFRIKPDGTDFAKLHDFNGVNGSTPEAELIMVNNVLFGTTDAGGASGMGTVFRINPDGTGFSVLHSFMGTDGAVPSRGLVHDREGNLYGMTSSGGVNNMGVIYKVSTTGSGFRRLFEFSQESGGMPDGALVIREDTYRPDSIARPVTAQENHINVTIHPNPSADNFRIHINSSRKERIQLVVTDQYGQTITTYEIINNEPMQFGSDLKRGLYIVKVIQGGYVSMRRLVKK